MTDLLGISADTSCALICILYVGHEKLLIVLLLGTSRNSFMRIVLLIVATCGACIKLFSCYYPAAHKVCSSSMSPSSAFDVSGWQCHIGRFGMRFELRIEITVLTHEKQLKRVSV